MPGKQAIFGTANENADENEKLVELFRNRAELKKEFAALDKEKYRLQQRVREQQGSAISRACSWTRRGFTRSLSFTSFVR